MTTTTERPVPDPVSPEPFFSRRPVVAPLETAGKIMQFGVRVITEIPAAIGLYPSEVVRQTGRLLKSSAVIIWMMMFVIGAEVGLQGHYLLDQIGAASYIGVFNALGDIRPDAAMMWGWIFAAKVSCGYVAEIGSMRISEEIDALEVMGIRPISYLAGSRVLAAWIASPFIFFFGIAMEFLGSWLISQVMLDTVSPGGYSDVFWSFQTPADIMSALTWSMIGGTIIVIVGCYFGYTASGGPVGVGNNTAKSMMVNMIVVSMVGLVLYQFFFNTQPVVPIGN